MKRLVAFCVVVLLVGAAVANASIIPCTVDVTAGGEVVPLSDELRERITTQNDEMSRQALRVLAVCERSLPSEITDYTPGTGARLRQ